MRRGQASATTATAKWDRCRHCDTVSRAPTRDSQVSLGQKEAPRIVRGDDRIAAQAATPDELTAWLLSRNSRHLTTPARRPRDFASGANQARSRDRDPPLEPDCVAA